MTRPAFYAMTLEQLAAWVAANDRLGFDELPGIDELSDEEQVTAREDYESAAEEIYASEAA